MTDRPLADTAPPVAETALEAAVAGPAPAPVPSAVPLPAPAPTAGDAAAPSSSVVQSTPYRLLPESPFVVVPSAPHLLGSTLYVYGFLLWAFVVAGELVTSYAPEGRGFLLGETAAVVGVLVATAWAWSVVLRRMLVARRGAVAILRSCVVGAFAAFLWLVTLFLSAAVGKAASKTVDGSVTFVLLVLSIGVALGGRRLAGLHVHPRTPERRMIDGIFWAAGALLTCVVIGELGNAGH